MFTHPASAAGLIMHASLMCREITDVLGYPCREAESFQSKVWDSAAAAEGLQAVCIPPMLSHQAQRSVWTRTCHPAYGTSIAIWQARMLQY